MRTHKLGRAPSPRHRFFVNGRPADLAIRSHFLKHPCTEHFAMPDKLNWFELAPEPDFVSPETAAAIRRACQAQQPAERRYGAAPFISGGGLEEAREDNAQSARKLGELH